MKVTNHHLSNKLIMAICLSACCSIAKADNQANLQITGKLIPTTCNITLSSPNIQLGNIHYGQLNKLHDATIIKSNSLGTVENIGESTLNINCNSKASVGFYVADNHNNWTGWNIANVKWGNHPIGEGFGLKNLSGSDKFGGYFIDYTSPKADNHEVTFTKGEKNTDLNFWGSPSEKTKAKDFSVTVKPKLFFYYNPQKISESDEIDFEGSTTFTIKYL